MAPVAVAAPVADPVAAADVAVGFAAVGRFDGMVDGMSLRKVEGVPLGAVEGSVVGRELGEDDGSMVG